MAHLMGRNTHEMICTTKFCFVLHSFPLQAASSWTARANGGGYACRPHNEEQLLRHYYYYYYYYYFQQGVEITFEILFLFFKKNGQMHIFLNFFYVNITMYSFLASL